MFFDNFSAYTNAVYNELLNDSKLVPSISDDNTKWVIEFEIPRIKKEQVKVTVDGNELNISIDAPSLTAKKKYRISDNADMTSVKAKVEDGVLSISIDKCKKSIKEVKIE